jgi:peptidoglycan/xylan/chitin deacetylase (PgdA/CDA1 family)
MRFYFVKTPSIITSFFKRYIWCFITTNKTIYLTFDDGPTPEVTEFVLDTLKSHNAKATFFCIGKNIKNNSAIFRQIIKEGHTVGNHTYNHLNAWKTDRKTYIDDVLKTEKIINESDENSAKLFRPPYGKIKISQAKTLRTKGYKIIMWSVLSADFDLNITKERVLNNILKNTKSGSIIVMHDSKKSNEHIRFVLPKILEYYNEFGFEFKAIS